MVCVEKLGVNSFSIVMKKLAEEKDRSETKSHHYKVPVHSTILSVGKWGPAKTQVVQAWLISAGIWIVASVSATIYFTDWNVRAALLPPSKSETNNVEAEGTMESTEENTRSYYPFSPGSGYKNGPVKCDSQRKSDKICFGANYQPDTQNNSNNPKINNYPTVVNDQQFVFGETKRINKNLENKCKCKVQEVSNTKVEEGLKSATIFDTGLEVKKENGSLSKTIASWFGFQLSRNKSQDIQTDQLKSCLKGENDKTTFESVSSQPKLEEIQTNLTPPSSSKERNNENNVDNLASSNVFDTSSMDPRGNSPRPNSSDLKQTESGNKSGYWDRSMTSIRRLIIRKTDE